MAKSLLAGIETGGTKILARLCEMDSGELVAERKWATGAADEAADALTEFLSSAVPAGAELAAIGLAAFGPLIVDPSSPDYGRMLATPKPGWSDSNLRARLAERLGVDVAVDTDVNAAAIAEQALGAGEELPSVAYVTVGTGIGAGLALQGRSFRGALHPEAGHIRLVRRHDDAMPSTCPFHSDCAEGLAAGPAVRRRLGEGRELADEPQLAELTAHYLGQLAAALVLAWSPHRIVWGGGVSRAAPMFDAIEAALKASLAGYGVGEASNTPGFCVPAKFENSGLEGALLMAKRLAGRSALA